MGRGLSLFTFTLAVALVAIGLATVSKAETDPLELIGGTVVDLKEWPASPWTGNCSATLIGPRVLLTAAHCVPNGGTKSFTISGRTYRTAPCEHHPLYRANYSNDYALCALAEDVPVKAESVAQPFQYPCAVGSEALWTGFGCTRWGQGIDGKFRIGKTSVTHCPRDQDGQHTEYVVTRGNGVALCSGDSGGGGFVVFPDGSRAVIGVNSRSDTTVTSYVSATFTPGFRDWAADFVVRKNVEICGMGADQSKCRGTVSEPPPDAPPPATHTVYRLYNSRVVDHLWSRSQTEGTPSYQLEGAAFRLFSEAGSGRSPLYRCFVPRIGHFLSRDAACERTGYWNEGVLGFVSTAPATGVSPLTRCYATMGGHLHFLTTLYPDECRRAGHTIQGQQGYAPL